MFFLFQYILIPDFFHILLGNIGLCSTAKSNK